MLQQGKIKVKYAILLFFVYFLIGCSTTQRAEWLCIADVEKNSNCKIIPCTDIQKVCATGKYRIMKIYPTKTVYIYSLDPGTDMKQCITSWKYELKRQTP